MQFVLLGFDGKDADALKRRMAAREKHLAGAAEMRRAGRLLYAAALLNDEDQMDGSLLVCDFDSRAALDHWLESEAYVTGKVWEKIRVIPCKVAEFKD